MSFSCPICKNDQFKHELSCIDYTVSKEKFDIVSCKKCGLWQTYPYPKASEINKYYESKEYISHSDKKESFFDKTYHAVRKYTLIQKINLIKKNVPCGTILDYGCGTGYFLEICQKNNFEAYGVELNDNAREIAKQKNITVHKDLSLYIKENKKFDLVTLWHVLEHLYHPDKFIEEIHGLIKEKGFLIIALPNRNSYDAFYYKEKWAGYDVPRHLYHYTKKDVFELTKKKFNVIKIYPMFFDSFYVSMLSEKYEGQNKYFFLKGLWRGMISNIKAISNNEYSSLIYVLQKN